MSVFLVSGVALKRDDTTGQRTIQHTARFEVATSVKAACAASRAAFEATWPPHDGWEHFPHCARRITGLELTTLLKEIHGFVPSGIPIPD